MRRHGLTISAVLISSRLITACGSETESAKPSSIIDQDSMVEIHGDTPLPTPGLKSEFAAIGRMSGGCTAFHLGNGLVATAGHCVADLGANPEETACHSLDITWGLLAGEPVAGHSRCLKVLQYKYDQQADYAFLQVDPIPATAIAIEPEPKLMKFAAQALVVGYPKGKTLSLSGLCDAVVVNDPATQIFHHRCDTLPGNSGSPVLDARSAAVIGIHNGDADNSENYGSFLPPAASLEKIAADLKKPQALPESLQFGPFPDRLKKNLVNFTRSQAEFVSFHLSTAVEDGYDKLVLIDGLGRSYEWTGKHEVQYDHLPTPVSLVMLTDYSGSSESVRIEAIRPE